MVYAVGSRQSAWNVFVSAIAGWVSKHRGLAGAIIITIAGAIVSGTWVQPGDLHDHQAHQTISPSAATWEITATATAPQLQIEAGKNGTIVVDPTSLR